MAGTGARQALLAALHDRELAALARVGDRSAFGELARRHSGAVRLLMRRLGADAALADDLAQDALLAAFERIADFREEGAFSGWLKAIAARLYIKRWRRGRAGRWGDVDWGSGEPERPTSDVAAQAAGRMDLEDALALLPSAERLCVSLCYGAGLSHAEAAESLGLPLGTVKSQVRRGLGRLKARLALPPPVQPSAKTNQEGQR